MIWRSKSTVMFPPNTTMMEAKNGYRLHNQKRHFSISLNEWRAHAGTQRLFMETNADFMGS